MTQHGRDRLAAYQKRSELKGFELAELLGIPHPTLSKLLSGKRLPTLPIAIRIQQRTGVSVESWTPLRRGSLGKTKRANAKPTNVSNVASDNA